jgi:hypothetical protein
VLAFLLGIAVQAGDLVVRGDDVERDGARVVDDPVYGNYG